VVQAVLFFYYNKLTEEAGRKKRPEKKPEIKKVILI
jgi:hypothetical protein